MEIRYLPLSQIRAEDSRFRINKRDPVDVSQSEVLQRSLSDLNWIEPLLVWEEGEENYHLVIGFKRAAIARQNNVSEIPCYALPKGISIRHVIDILFTDRVYTITTSAVSRVDFICFALNLGISETELIQSYFPVMQLEPHVSVLQRCVAVAGLPGEVLQYCHDKRYSIKQCIHLTRYPRDLLEKLFAWKTQLALTTSIIDELLEGIGDYLRRTGMKAHALLNGPEITGLFEQDINCQLRTKLLRDQIRQWRYPVLTETNEKIKQVYQRLNLPKNVMMKWDPTLENEDLVLSIRLGQQGDWSKTLEELRRPTVPIGITEIFGYL